GGTFNGGVPATFAGNISGTGTATFSGFDANQTISAATTYTGQTRIADGTLVIGGSGSIANSPVVNVSGTLLLNGSGNEIGDTANLVLNGTGVQFAVSSHTETIGTLTTAAGQSTVTSTVSNGGANKLAATALARTNRGGIFFRAANIGT